MRLQNLDCRIQSRFCSLVHGDKHFPVTNKNLLHHRVALSCCQTDFHLLAHLFRVSSVDCSQVISKRLVSTNKTDVSRLSLKCLCGKKKVLAQDLVASPDFTACFSWFAALCLRCRDSFAHVIAIDFDDNDEHFRRASEKSSSPKFE